jgi:Fe-S oxidoreductase
MGAAAKKSRDLVPPGLVYISDNIISKDNILGAPKKEKAKWAESLKLPRNRETIFFAGCGYQFTSALESMMSIIRKTDKSVIGADFAMSMASVFQKKLGIDGGEILRKISAKGNGSEAQPLVDAVNVLKKIGIDFGYLAEEEPCCGGLLYYTGMQADFAKISRHVYQRLKSHGVKRVIGIVPSCTYTLRNLAAGFVEGYDIQVQHFSQVVAENLPELRLEYPRDVRVVYHDPCQLSRYLGLVDEPRRILRAIKGVDVVEPDWTKGEWSTCCGGGGGFEAVYPELSQILAANRARELVKTGANIIVTQCPGCIMQLKEGLKEIKAEGVEVLDMAEIIAQAMGV